MASDTNAIIDARNPDAPPTTAILNDAPGIVECIAA